jgi:hypothetical protein
MFESSTATIHREVINRKLHEICRGEQTSVGDESSKAIRQLRSGESTHLLIDHAVVT